MRDFYKMSSWVYTNVHDLQRGTAASLCKFMHHNTCETMHDELNSCLRPFKPLWALHFPRRRNIVIFREHCTSTATIFVWKSAVATRRRGTHLFFGSRMLQWTKAWFWYHPIIFDFFFWGIRPDILGQIRSHNLVNWSPSDLRGLRLEHRVSDATAPGWATWPDSEFGEILIGKLPDAKIAHIFKFTNALFQSWGVRTDAWHIFIIISV